MPQYLSQLHISAAELVALGRSPYHGFINKLTESDKKIIDYAVTVTDTSKHLEKEKRKQSFFVRYCFSVAVRTILRFLTQREM